jgi:tetratricopeptide (TPR) repeat protein
MMRLSVPALAAAALFVLSTLPARAEWGESINRALAAFKAKDFKAAEQAALEAFDKAEGFAQDDDRVIQNHVVLADIYRETRQWAAASEQLKFALAGHASRGRQEGQEASNLQNKLGIVCTQMKDYDCALPAFEAALNIKRQKYAENAASIASVVTNLAELCRRKADLPRALALHQQAIADKEGALGADHPALVASLNDIALVLRDLKRHDEAVAPLQRALELAKKNTAPGGRADVGTTLHNIGDIAAALGKRDEAVTHFEQALAIRRAELSPNHPQLSDTLNAFGNVLVASGKGDDGLAMLDEAIAIRREEFGKADQRTLLVMNNKVIALERVGRKAEAETLRAEIAALKTKP